MVIEYSCLQLLSQDWRTKCASTLPLSMIAATHARFLFGDTSDVTEMASKNATIKTHFVSLLTSHLDFSASMCHCERHIKIEIGHYSVGFSRLRLNQSIRLGLNFALA